MEMTGYTIKMENFGRIVIPIKVRKRMGIELQDSLEIYVEEDQIVIRKYHPACVFCDDMRNLVRYKDVMICKDCREQLKQVPGSSL